MVTSAWPDARQGIRRSAQRGFTYLWLLLAIAVLGLGLEAASEVWVTSANRQKLAELDWIGAQFVRAIGSYYQATPGAIKAYPASLQDLTEDRRSATVRRHLREVYLDPFTGRRDWQPVLAPDGHIQGVRMASSLGRQVVRREFVYLPGRTELGALPGSPGPPALK